MEKIVRCVWLWWGMMCGWEYLGWICYQTALCAIAVHILCTMIMHLVTLK